MDYEKLYKGALERARMINNGKDVDVELGTTICEYIFPELKESDERIRKDISKALRGEGMLTADETDRCLAWLEKQGERKPIMIDKACEWLECHSNDFMMASHETLEDWLERKKILLKLFRKAMEE